jgi:Ni,Fe-hydrogenase maturation factor
VVIGIEPEIVVSYVPMSDKVRAAVPDLMTAVERQLEDWGHELQPREVLAGA